jgi:hypothetical protein
MLPRYDALSGNERGHGWIEPAMRRDSDLAALQNVKIYIKESFCCAELLSVSTFCIFLGQSQVRGMTQLFGADFTASANDVRKLFREVYPRAITTRISSRRIKSQS